MACNIDQANKDIDRLLESSISEDIKQELRDIKKQLAQAKQLKLEENKDNKSSENRNYSTDEIISNIYNENNKLQKIGTKEQYLDYIKNKISDSSAKTLLYYGTPIQEKIEKPKQSSSGRYGKGVYLTDSFEEAKLFAYTKDQQDIFGYTDENELPLGQILVGYTTEGNSIEAKQAKGDNDFIEFSSLDSLVTEPHNIEQIRKKENVNLIIGDNGKSFTPSKEFVVDEDSLVILGSLEDVKDFKSNIKTLLVNNDTKTKENKDNKNNISVHKKLDDIVKKYMIDNNLEYDYEIYDVERDEGIIYQLIIKSDWYYDFEVIKDIRKLVHEKLNDKNIIVDDDTIPFSVQQVLEQYKKDENIEKENAKLLKYIQDNVKFEMNYSKQLAYDFFTGESIAGLYDWKENVVTIADFEGLKADKEMMKMLSIEQVNQNDSVKDIDTASTQINMIISEINKRNIKFTTKLHESVHAAVFNYMRSDKGKVYNDEMTKLYEIVKESAKSNPDMFTTNKSYWSKDVDEFIAEALSKPELIKDLMKIDVEGNLITGAEKSMFEKIIDMIVEALGLYTKEDKLNMHKYLLDSFKAAVEANKDGKEYMSSKAPEVEYQKDSKYPSTSKNKVLKKFDEIPNVKEQILGSKKDIEGFKKYASNNKLNTTLGSESKKSIHHSLSGKIILANSGIGKSYAKRIYNNIVDGDDLFRDAANFILEKYNQSEYKIDSVSNMRGVFELWGEYSSDIDKVTEAKKRRDEVYRKYAEFAKESSKNGMTVLSSSAREPIISIADFAIVQNDAETIAKNRSSELRENKEELSVEKAKEKIHSFRNKISGIKTINLYKDQYISEILEKGVTINDFESIDNNKYKTISKDDIEAAKDIMLKNKEECR